MSEVLDTRADVRSQLAEQIAQRQAQNDRDMHQMAEINTAEATEETERELAFDRRTVQSWNLGALSEQVSAARRRLADLLAADPITLAAADLAFAEMIRSEMAARVDGAASRIGMAPSPAAGIMVPPANPVDVGAIITAEAGRIASERLEAERAAFWERRTSNGDVMPPALDRPDTAERKRSRSR